MTKKYDVIVVGGGHAGCEAVLAASRMGARVLLVTLKKEAIGYTSCNPSIGGIGKGQLVKEIDALGGEMAKAADASAIQFRMLNSSKGYAARSSRMQIDRKLYNIYMRNRVLSQKGLDVVEDEVKEVIADKRGACLGVSTKDGKKFIAPCVVLTTGTFMNGLIHIGLEHFAGGRIGEGCSTELSSNLSSFGFNIGRFKTGTPARLDGKTIDFSALTRQDGDESVIPFSFSNKKLKLKQLPCYITRTNQATHEIIKQALERSPLYTGKIKSTGVRYCPSIEDKIVRFKDRDSHIIFLEPEGLDTDEYYPNGISTSLPLDVQLAMLRSIKGLERVKINRSAYAIEYDFVDPLQLFLTLETKIINGLFMAGQINGTTGYEEAACLGLMAGINACLKVKGKPPLILGRHDAYIGVLVDDLVTKGTKEPYRMFTSRVEYRLLIREDNAENRLSGIGHTLGLVSKAVMVKVNKKTENVSIEKKRLSESAFFPDEVNGLLRAKGETGTSFKMSCIHILKRAGVSYEDIVALIKNKPAKKLSYYEQVQLEIDVKYASYIERELREIRKFSDLEKIRIPSGFDYSKIPGLTTEIKEKLINLQPASLGQASRISGVTPAAISILMVKLRQ